MTDTPSRITSQMPAAGEGRGTLAENRAVRLLRAKAAELEQQVKYGDVRGVDDLHTLVADVALIAGLLADDIESRHGGRRVPMQEPGDTGVLR